MTGANHAVQRIVLQGLPYPTPKSDNNSKKKRGGLGAVLQALKNIHLGRSNAPPAGLPAPAIRSQAVQPEPVSPEETMRQARARIDNATDIILMEYMAHGSVQDLIEHMVAKKTRVSNRALWMILECLFKGCVAMAYPLRFAEQGKDLYNASHARQDEVVPLEAGHQLPRDPIVHFDLDPQNGQSFII